MEDALNSVGSFPFTSSAPLPSLQNEEQNKHKTEQTEMQLLWQAGTYTHVTQHGCMAETPSIALLLLPLSAFVDFHC